MKKISIVLMTILIVIQFIQPGRNSQDSKTASINMPENIKRILSRSCFDCHSNNTRYPWYANIQPVGWILARHIREGKANLNFDEFTSYSKRRQANKLRAVRTSMKERSMPLYSYLIMHHEATLSATEMTLVTKWAQKGEDSISHKKS